MQRKKGIKVGLFFEQAMGIQWTGFNYEKDSKGCVPMQEWKEVRYPFKI